MSRTRCPQKINIAFKFLIPLLTFLCVLALPVFPIVQVEIEIKNTNLKCRLNGRMDEKKTLAQYYKTF